MKRVRLDTWVCQLQPPRNPRLTQRCAFSSNLESRSTRPEPQWQPHQVCHRRAFATSKRRTSTAAATTGSKASNADAPPPPPPSSLPRPKPSPRQEQATSTDKIFDGNRRIAKLSALHARLALPAKLPLHTLARCLVDASADQHPGRNNASLAILGQDLLAYYTAEHLTVNYPRLPMAIMFAAQYSYSGPDVLAALRSEWGVELAAAPGTEVDRALLQFKRMTPGNALAEDGMSRMKDTPTTKRVGWDSRGLRAGHRRGMTSRIVNDDEFGELRLDTKPYEGLASSVSAKQPPKSFNGSVTTPDVSFSEDELSSDFENKAAADSSPRPEIQAVTAVQASASFIRSLVGAIYLHAGDEAVKNFHKEHILSRHLELHKLFAFRAAPRDLNRLCAREGFELPVARLLSETGRLSRTPVFVVGVYSGADKLGEAAGASLPEARGRAAAAALRSWYLYSPPIDDIMLPSDMEVTPGAQQKKKWIPQMVDVGEVII